MMFFLAVAMGVAQAWERMADQGYCARDEQKIFRAVAKVKEFCEKHGVVYKFWGDQISAPGDRW